MSDSMLQRVRRILNGRLEDAIDRMERAGSDSVMREAVREVERAIDAVKADHESAVSRRLLAARQQKGLREKAEELTGKARFALSESRDDLAEAALGRQVDFETQADKLDAVQAEAREAEAEYSQCLAALEARKREMEDALRAFAATRKQAAAYGFDPSSARRDLEKRVDKAEQAFERAMNGGPGFTRSDAQTVNLVAKIDVLQKQSVVAQRLAALKQAANAR